MKKLWKALAACCLFAAFTGAVSARAEEAGNAAPPAVSADYTSIAVSQVSGYVNIREQATTTSKIVGKIYNNCAATILETVQGKGGEWYRIQSGTVNGFIKAEYFITGEAAENLAQSIGREFVTINASNLRLREQPNLTSRTLTMLPQGARYVVQAEEGDFFKVEVDADLVGYIAQSYCVTEVVFDQAVSLEEERAKLEEESRRKREAQTAIAALEQVIRVEENRLAAENAAAVEAETQPASPEVIIAANPVQSDNSQNTTAPTLTVGPGASTAVVSATRSALVAYAKQFLGNPYLYGGTSLTEGADCSGFTQGVFAHFGITTGRSSRDQAEKGREIAISDVQPGDLLFYASGGTINHVALYIGGNEVIHASNPTTGITISPYNYRTPCKAVTFLD